MKQLATIVTNFSIRAPRVIAMLMTLSTLALMGLAIAPTVSPTYFPMLQPATVDTDPENMLSADEPVRVAHNQHKERFVLHDAIVLGVVDEASPTGVFTPDTLRRVHEITAFVKDIEGVVAADVMSPSTVDDMKNTSAGVIQFDYLMPTPPETPEAAQALAERIKRQPFLDGTLVSENGKALAIYVPIESKHIAHEVTEQIKDKLDAMGEGTAEWHFAGLPVAEDTFGIEMFKQMAITAPVAMLVIFLLMWVFFRKISMIISPMLVAMASALSTMALLVITGNTIHIMSSMIPIFIMPIAVLDAIHIISDFFDRYQETRDRAETLRHVMGDLFTPMLFTSLTTTVGFASLALTPIPPVQVFGFFVAAGVLAAWFWTITFVPAFIMLIPESKLDDFGRQAEHSEDLGRMARFTARFTARRAGLVLLGTAGLAVLAGYGISLININDNPTRWFEESHPVRVADRVLNTHFGGTYDAYLTFDAEQAAYTAEQYAAQLQAKVEARKGALNTAFTALAAQAKAASGEDVIAALDGLDAYARAQRKGAATPAEVSAWAIAGDFVGDQLTRAEEAADNAPPPAEGAEAPAFDRVAFAADFAAEAQKARTQQAAAFAALADAVTKAARITPADAEAFRAEVLHRAPSPLTSAVIGEAAQAGQVFKDPQVLAWMSRFQAALVESGLVGKSNSLADIVKAVHRDLVSGDDADYRLPERRAMVAQTLEQFLSSHRKDDIWHFTTPAYDAGVVWMQLRSGDNSEMQKVVAFAEGWLADNPPPLALAAPTWSGLTYINVVWQEKMVSGMLDALVSSFIVVLVMMIFLFRSILWGLFSMIPLTVTVGFIYGITGLVGKDYDMPVAVLSSLSLGLAIDYAIHFLARSRDLRARMGTWEAARQAVFAEPARAISRNVVVVGVGFLPLLAAPLVPYQTVGLLIASILLFAGGASLFILPALITVFDRWLFKREAAEPAPQPAEAH